RLKTALNDGFVADYDPCAVGESGHRSVDPYLADLVCRLLPGKNHAGDGRIRAGPVYYNAWDQVAESVVCHRNELRCFPGHQVRAVRPDLEAHREDVRFAIVLDQALVVL